MKYLWFDTNCFSELINQTFLLEERKQIYSCVSNGEGKIVISPFVFYEIIMGRDKLSEIYDDLYIKLINMPDFYIANFGNTFNMNSTLIEGKELINHMKMGEVLGDNAIEYGWFRDGYKNMVGKAYSIYLTEYAKMASVVYIICDECNDRGNINQRTENKVSYVEQFNNIGRNQNTIEKDFSNFFIFYNTTFVGDNKRSSKNHFQEKLLNYVNVFLGASEVKEQMIEEGLPYDVTTFNRRLSDILSHKNVNLDRYHITTDNVSKKTNNALSPKLIYQKFVKRKISKPLFAEAFEDFVSKRVLYKNMCNDFIDLINIYCAGTFLSGEENIYYTNDKAWIAFLREHREKNIFEGNVLYARYYVHGNK